MMSLQWLNDKNLTMYIIILSSLTLKYIEGNWLQVFQNYSFLKKFYLSSWNNLLNNLFIVPDSRDEIYVLLKR